MEKMEKTARAGIPEKTGKNDKAEKAENVENNALVGFAGILCGESVRDNDKQRRCTYEPTFVPSRTSDGYSNY